MSSIELLTERLAEFHLAAVQHTDHTEHTDSTTGHVEKWFTVRGIGEGTFGLVLLEQEAGSKELRAVKTVDVRANARISPLREIHALTKLTKRSPYFVEFRGWWEEHDAARHIHRLHIAMEFCEGGDLEKYLQHHGIFNEEDGKTIMKQIFQGLEFLHAESFTHRDLKPSNIFVAEVSPQIRIKIGDLGLAKYTGVDAGTELHTVAGTRDYTAPEVTGMYAHDGTEQDYYTSAVDIWSSGCVAHKILTDKLPFPNGLGGLLSGRVAFSTSRLVERNVSRPAQKLLRRMLAAAPQNRPTAKECFDDAWIAAPTTAKERRRRSPRRSTHVELPPPMDVVVVSSTERVTERLAAFQLATVQHTDHTEHTDHTGHIENWFVVRVVGEGTYGLVRLEQESQTNEFRAVKTVKIGPKSTRAWREMHALAEITKSSYFVEFRGWWEEHDAARHIHRLHIAMEFCEGGDLEKYLQHHGVFNEEEGKTIMKQVFEGLEFLHAKGFTHRDIKPRNIYIAELSPRIRIKIGGLGLSGSDSDTMLHTAAGTREYTAPEVIGLSAYDEKETDDYTSAVDIWSSGCTAHKILTNQLPFGSRSLFEYVVRLKGFPAERLVERNVGEPARKLLQRMLAPASHDRPSAKECLEDAWFTTTQAKAVLSGGFSMSNRLWRKEG